MKRNMMNLIVKPVKRNGVIIKVENNTVHIFGSIDHLDPETYMTQFFNELHENIKIIGLKKVNVDIRKLNFINSSGIKELVVWVMMINEEKEAKKKYRVNFICNKDLPWQRNSLSTLQLLNQDVSILS